MPKVTPILPSRSNNTYDSSFDATNASMKEDNSGIDDASMMDDDVIEDSLIEDKENDGEISRERSLLGSK
uniref:Uncharacterized protein n=1 Tax=Panagrolaimus superbus TaxID=310955 RepID=A0A914YL19_9BILA